MMLLDLPAPAMQAVLLSAGPSGTASLRAAGRASAAAVSDAVPSLHCALTAASTREDAAEWLRATRRLGHAPELVLALDGAVAAAPVDALFAALSRRGAPRAVAVRSGGSGGATAAMATAAVASASAPAASLPAECLARLPAGVTSLALSGVALRPAADGTTALAGLAASAAAATLRSLELGAGWAGAGASMQAASWSLAALGALPRLERLSVALPPPAFAALPAALAGSAGGDAFEGPQLRDAAAGVVAALLRLTRLAELSVAGLPDVWAPRGHAAVAAADRAAATDDDDDGDDAALALLPRTLEGLAARLASELPALRSLDVALAGGWGMEWRAAAASGGALALASIDAAAHLAPRGRTPRAAAAAAAAAAAVAAAAEGRDLRAALEAALAPYVAAAPADALPAVRSLRLALAPAHLAGLEGALRAMPALEALRVAVMATAAAGREAPLADLLAAVAAGAGGRLAELAVLPGLAPAPVAPAALAPLLRLPGLRALKLAGALRPDGPGAWAPLARLAGLRRLALHNVAAAKAAFAPALVLPPALDSVDLKGLRLTEAGTETMTMAAAAVAAAAPRSVRLVGCDASATGLAVAGISGPGVVEATVAGCALGPAGWRSAAEAWPRLTSLRAALGAAAPTAGAAAAAAVSAAEAEASEMLGAALPRMAALESVALQRLPRLGDGELAALLALPALRRLCVGAAACDLTPGGAAAPAPAPRRLRSVALQLPARHLPRGLQAVIAGGVPAEDVPAGVPAPWWVLAAAAAAAAAAAEGKGAAGGRLADALRSTAPGAAVEVTLNQAPLASVARGGGDVC